MPHSVKAISDKTKMTLEEAIANGTAKASWQYQTFTSWVSRCKMIYDPKNHKYSEKEEAKLCDRQKVFNNASIDYTRKLGKKLPIKKNWTNSQKTTLKISAQSLIHIKNKLMN